GVVGQLADELVEEIAPRHGPQGGAHLAFVEDGRSAGAGGVGERVGGDPWYCPELADTLTLGGGTPPPKGVRTGGSEVETAVPRRLPRRGRAAGARRAAADAGGQGPGGAPRHPARLGQAGGYRI